MTVVLINHSGSEIQLFSGVRGIRQNAVATFISNKSVLNCTLTSPTITGNIVPLTSSNFLFETNSQGTCTLKIIDSFADDGRTLNSWSLNICTVPNTELSCGTRTIAWNISCWSNDYPINNISAIIQENFISNTKLEAYSLDIFDSTNVVVSNGSNFIIQKEVVASNTASLTFQNNSNLIQIENGTNSGNAIVFRDTNPLKRLDYFLWSNPLTSSQTLKNFSLETLNSRFYLYNMQANDYSVIANPESTVFTPGNGYLIRMLNNHPTITGSFTNGNLNNGNYIVNLGYFGVGQNFNLVGNPYPSTINAETFLINNNSDINGVIYLFRGENNAVGSGYATYTLGGSTTTTATSSLPNGII